MLAVLWFLRAVVILLILRFVFRLLAGAAQVGGPTRPTPGRPAERAGGELVRDPQCGTYVPKTRAMAVARGGVTTYFCSAACRDAFEATPVDMRPVEMRK